MQGIESAGRRMKGRLSPPARSPRRAIPGLGAGEFSRSWTFDEHAELEMHHGKFRSHRFVPHTHDSYFVGVIVHGSVASGYRGSFFDARAGTILVVEPGEVHSGYPGVEEGWRSRSFFIGVDVICRIADEVGHGEGLPTFANAVIDDPVLARRLCELHRTFETSQERLLQDSGFLEVLVSLLSGYSIRKAEWHDRSDRPAVRRAQAYIRETLDKNVSLDEVAGSVGYSPFHFHRVFREEVGLTPHGYQLTVRIERARMLLNKGLSLVDTALECGFSDQSHLTRRFKQVMGYTPGQYVQSRAGTVRLR